MVSVTQNGCFLNVILSTWRFVLWISKTATILTIWSSLYLYLVCFAFFRCDNNVCYQSAGILFPRGFRQPFKTKLILVMWIGPLEPITLSSPSSVFTGYDSFLSPAYLLVVQWSIHNLWSETSKDKINHRAPSCSTVILCCFANGFVEQCTLFLELKVLHSAKSFRWDIWLCFKAEAAPETSSYVLNLDLKKIKKIFYHALSCMYCMLWSVNKLGKLLGRHLLVPRQSINFWELSCSHSLMNTLGKQYGTFAPNDQ